MLRLFALAGFAMTVLGVSPGHAQAQAQDTTLYTVTYVEVGPVLAKVGAGALHAYRNAARKEAVSLDVFQRIDRPNQFVVLGTWTDQKAFDAHNAGDATKKLNEKLATLLAAPNDTRQHNALSVAPAKPGKDAIIAAVEVTWPSGAKQRFTNVPSNQFVTITEDKGITAR